jgi:hypothetical protein
MSEVRSFELVSEEVAREVLQAATANQDANEHLTEYCGCATVRHDDKVYFIVVPDGTTAETITLENGVHVLEILNSRLLEMIGDEETGCGNPVRPYIGHFLMEEGLEESDFYQTLVKSVEKSMARMGMDGPIPADFFEPVPAQQPIEDVEIPEELLAHLRNLVSPTSNLMLLEFQWKPEGIEITEGKTRSGVGLFKGLQFMLLRLTNKNREIPEELLQHVREFLSPASDVISLKMQVTPRGLSVDVGRISLQGLSQGLGQVNDVLDAMLNSIRGQGSNQPNDMFSFEEFLKANGINLGGNGGQGEDWLAALDDTDPDFSQFGGSTGATSTDEGEEE